MKTLVVDDEPDARTIMAVLLEGYGHEVVTAADGHEGLVALAAAAGHGAAHFDLIFLDLVMPKMNGLEMLNEARRQGLVNCPVIVSSGLDYEWVRGVAGVTAFIQKPIDPELIEKHLSTAGSKQS